jgi:hypothetical protein
LVFNKIGGGLGARAEPPGARPAKL